MLYSVLREWGSSGRGNLELRARQCLAALWKNKDLEELGMDELPSQPKPLQSTWGARTVLSKATSMPTSLMGVQAPAVRGQMGCPCSAGLLQRKERATEERSWTGGRTGGRTGA